MSERVGGGTVFCHECGNRWPRDQGGLTCPACSSEFVEILEGESINDDGPHPRRERSPSGFPGILPTLLRPLAPEHVEYRDPQGRMVRHQFSSRDGGFSFTTTSYRSPPLRTPLARSPAGSPAPAGGHPSSSTDDFMGGTSPPSQGFGFLFPGLEQWHASGMTGNFPRAAQTDPTTREDRDSYTNLYGSPFPGTSAPWHHSPHNHTHTPGAQRPPANPLEAVFQDLHNLRNQLGDTRAPPGIQGASFTLLAQILGMAHGGDAVYSQEEFDRVITQLMSQAGNSAPGPAPETAIQALPKKAVDKTMLGDDGNAECSICMDNVEIGTEVTVLPCNHWFHGNCISAWLHEHNTCPHCRRGITEQASNSSPRRGQNDNAPPLGSRANPFVVNDNSSPPGFQSGFQSASQSTAQSAAYNQRQPRSDNNGQNQSGSGRLSGWMRNHFGGSS